MPKKVKNKNKEVEYIKEYKEIIFKIFIFIFIFFILIYSIEVVGNLFL